MRSSGDQKGSRNGISESRPGHSILRRELAVSALSRKIGRAMAAASPTGTVVVKAGDQTIELSGQALDVLMELMESRNMTLGEVLAEAIAIQKAIADERDRGGRVVVERKGEIPRELVVA